MARNGFLGAAVAVSALSLTLSAGVIIDKGPDQGPYWSPLSAASTYVYADSFVFTGSTGTLAETLGIYMLSQDGMGSNFRFELLADLSDAPDPNTVLAVTDYQQFNDPDLHLVTGSLLIPYALVNGVRYWVAGSTVGQSGGAGYQVGGHTQNSIYQDDGTFWYSNDAAGMSFDGQGLTPEMAIYVSNSAPSAVPEPATYACVVAGLAVLALLRRRVPSGRKG